jgi:tRNA (guanine26-N2/guanine27-N2)-dimethyltransferase
VLEALAATGLRSVRYLKEIPNIKTLVTNDWDPKAVELIKQNMDFNDVETDKYEPFAKDAVDLLN